MTKLLKGNHLWYFDLSWNKRNTSSIDKLCEIKRVKEEKHEGSIY
jgi:hypothetical protein